jgi:hypothetical protein
VGLEEDLDAVGLEDTSDGEDKTPRRRRMWRRRGTRTVRCCTVRGWG